MRTFPASYTYANAASEKSPRFVVGILFDTDSIYLTSHPGIPNVPGTVIENVLTVKDAVSMRVVPDEGRSEIGVVNFDVLDKNYAATSAFQIRLQAGHGLRGKTIRMYHGFAGADFSQFQIFQTQKVASCGFDRGVYSFKCADISREQRKEIFDPKTTRLTSTIDADDTTIPVANTSAFEMVEHGSSYSDAPSSEVGYIQIEKEIIRWTGKTDTTFTGCTRGVLNTRAVPHTVDVNTPADQRTEVKEVIYLEMPAVKLLLAVLTGEIYGQSATLPAHWHLGIDPVWIRESDFTGIGNDLWDLTSDSISFVPRFLGLKKTDGKKFLESEVYQLIGCYPLIYADGTIGIRRMNRVLRDAPYVAVLDASNVVSWSELTHDMEGVVNDYRVDWNFDVDGKATRITRLVDGDSINIHGQAPQKSLQFRGLYGSRHTDSTVKARLDAIRDRYAHPPELQTVQCMPRMNYLELGDIVRNRLPLVRDFAGSSFVIDRSMEIQRSRINLANGEVEFELFGSTGLASTNPLADDDGGEGPLGENSVPDAWYESEGTELATEIDMTLVGDVWEVDAGSYNLAGDANMNSSAAVYYHLGDLTIPDGVTINLSANVQLRVRGFLTVNGVLNGVGRGLAGQVDTAGYGTTQAGLAGAIGTTRGMDGITIASQKVSLLTLPKYATLPPSTARGLWDQIPAFTIEITDAPSVTGIPSDLRGTSGGAGGKVIDSRNKTVLGAGGDGGNGGAGLCIVSRGLAIGLSGVINLSGDDTVAPSPVSSPSISGLSMTPGAGGVGCPGGLFILLDGNNLSLPDLSGGRFLALTGTSGAPLARTMASPSGGMFPWDSDAGSTAVEGFLDPALTSAFDMSNSAYRIQYMPTLQTPVEDQPSAVPPPTGLSATGVPNGILLHSTLPPFDLFDGVEVWMATTNDRSGATKVAEVKSTNYLHSLAPGTTRYFWERNRKAGPAGDLFSTWEPTSATGGVSATST